MHRALLIVSMLAYPWTALASGAADHWGIRETLVAARAAGTLSVVADRLHARRDVRDNAALRRYISGYTALLRYERPRAKADLVASFRLSESAAVAAAVAELGVEIGHPATVMEWTSRGLAAADVTARAEIDLRATRAQALAWLVRRDEGRLEAARAVDIARDLGDQRLLARALRAYAYSIEDQTDAALAAFADAVRLSENAGDMVAVGYHLLMMSGPYYPTRPFAQKLPLLDRALAIAIDVHDRQLEGRVRGARGLAYYQLARFSDALRDLTAADAILRETGALRSRAVAAGNLGVVFSALGDYQRAEQQIRLSIALYRRVDNRHGVRNCLDDLSRLALLQGRVSVAVTRHKQVVQLTRALGDGGYLRGALVRLGLAYAAAREWTAAETVIREALSSPSPSHPDVLAEARLALGHVLRQTNRLAEAERAYDDALAMAPALATAATLSVRARHGLALLATAAGRHDDALAHYRAALAGLERIRGAVEEYSWRLTYFADKSALYVDAIDAVISEHEQSADPELVREGLNFAERAKARTLFDELNLDGETVPSRSLEQIAAALGPSDLLIEFVLGEKRSFAFTVTPKRTIAVRTLPPRAVIERAVTTLRGHIAERPRSPADVDALRHAGMRAYATLLEPLLNDAENVRRLIIVADGQLWYAPFEALTISNTRTYVAERFEVARAASGLVFAALRGRDSSEARRTFVGFGDPSMTGPFDNARSDTIGALKREGFTLTPLPGSRREVEAAAAAFGSSARTVLGSSFTVEAVIAELQRPHHVVHFATHAILDERVPDRSGIVVSGASGSPSMLRVAEIAAMRVPVDLVALSACQTGLGRIVAGEGVLGLAWAFTRAGASSLLVTLWNVSDGASASMMAAFYEQLAAGQSKSTALHKSRQQLLRSDNPLLRHPYFWAGYVLIGDPE